MNLAGAPIRSLRVLTSTVVIALVAVHGVSALASGKDKASAPMAEGEVRRIDKDAGRITIKHGPIKTDTLDMDPMTMVFHVRDKAQLDAIKDGDRVRFRVVSEEGGRLTITEIRVDH